MSSVPAIVSPRGILVRVVDEQRLAVLGDPAGEPLADPAAQEVEVDVLVRADPTLEGDRHDLVRRLDEIDPGVVVVDDPARLLDDGPPDALDGRRAAQPAGCGLQDLELGGSRLGLLEELRVAERDAGVRRERRQERDVAVGPLARLEGHRRQRADHPVVVDQRRDEVARELEDAHVALATVADVRAGVGPGGHAAGPQDLVHPALADARTPATPARCRP